MPTPGMISPAPAIPASPAAEAPIMPYRPAIIAMPAEDITTMAPSPLPPSRRGLAPIA